MYFSDQGPHHLAEVVLRALTLTDMKAADPALLVFFFDVLYEASFRSDQGKPVRGSVLWQDPAMLSSASLSRPDQPDWKYLSFTHSIPFNVNTFVSLAAGLDPHTAMLAVYAADPQHPVIHGLVSCSASSSVTWEPDASAQPLTVLLRDHQRAGSSHG